MFEVHWYCYQGELLDRMKRQAEFSAAGHLLEHEVMINGKMKIAHVSLKEKRRDPKLVKEEIAKLKGEQSHLEKVSLPTKRERDRIDWIAEQLRHLANELYNTQNMKYIGKGVLVVPDGLPKPELRK